jgi:hypothetical protein
MLFCDKYWDEISLDKILCDSLIFKENSVLSWILSHKNVLLAEMPVTIINQYFYIT